MNLPFPTGYGTTPPAPRSPSQFLSNLLALLVSLAFRRERLYLTILALAVATIFSTLWVYRTDSWEYGYNNVFSVPTNSNGNSKGDLDVSGGIKLADHENGNTIITDLDLNLDLISTTTTTTTTTTTSPTASPTASPTPSPITIPHYAYIFYATTYDYACSTLINIDRLLHHPTIKAAPHIRIGVYISPQITQGLRDERLLSEAFENLAKSTNGRVFIVHADPPQGKLKKPVFHYKDVLLKLIPFDLGIRDLALASSTSEGTPVYLPWGESEGSQNGTKGHFVERMIILDADQLILRNLDHLFALPPVEIAAPRNYWGGSRDVPLGITTTLMVVQPSRDLWNRMQSAMDGMKEGEYDMDLVNHVFGNEILTLPGRYCTLNSHWEVNDQPFWYHNSPEARIHLSDQISWEDMMLAKDATVMDGLPMMNTNYSSKNIHQKGQNRSAWGRDGDKGIGLLWDAEVVHFTALGKPWSYSVEGVRIERPDAHWIFAEMFGDWRASARRMCPGWASKYGNEEGVAEVDADAEWID